MTRIVDLTPGRDQGREEKGLVPLLDILPKVRPVTPIQERLLGMPSTGEADSILYQHSVLCQTCMPYRDPGSVRTWQRRNGMVHLLIQAGHALDPRADAFVEVGLPFGPKPRLVLCHLNAEALRRQSPLIELEDSLTAFVKRTLGLDPGRPQHPHREGPALAPRGCEFLVRLDSRPAITHRDRTHHQRFRALDTGRSQAADALADHGPVFAGLLRQSRLPRSAAR